MEQRGGAAHELLAPREFGVPCRSIPSSRYGIGPSRVIPIDHAAEGDSAFQACFVQIVAGGTVATHPGGRPAWCRVLRGGGRTRHGRTLTTWSEGDSFPLSSGGTAAHSASQDACLLWVRHEEGAAPHREHVLGAGETDGPELAPSPIVVIPLDVRPGCWTLIGPSIDPPGRIVGSCQTAWERHAALVVPAGVWFSHRNESRTASRYLVLDEGPGR